MDYMSAKLAIIRQHEAHRDIDLVLYGSASFPVFTPKEKEKGKGAVVFDLPACGGSC
jgi:hypothetical protein